MDLKQDIEIIDGYVEVGTEDNCITDAWKRIKAAYLTPAILPVAPVAGEGMPIRDMNTGKTVRNFGGKCKPADAEKEG